MSASDNRQLRVGGLYVDDDGRVVMPVSAYVGLYGRQMADCIPVSDMACDVSAGLAVALQCAAWANPLGYFSDELSEIQESNRDREAI